MNDVLNEVPNTGSIITCTIAQFNFALDLMKKVENNPPPYEVSDPLWAGALIIRLGLHSAIMYGDMPEELREQAPNLIKYGLIAEWLPPGLDSMPSKKGIEIYEFLSGMSPDDLGVCETPQDIDRNHQKVRRTLENIAIVKYTLTPAGKELFLSGKFDGIFVTPKTARVVPKPKVLNEPSTYHQPLDC